ncbi:MAG: serine/threonine protein kinase, partial [Cyanobacteria bacterium]|nr:serine/threonine protein kinase [Cyanobacteriota bacterium]
ALDEVHKQGVVHRDLKPSNIMLIERDGNPHFVKLVDLGIAKIIEDTNKGLTQTGEAIGSPPYMSPEQCSGRTIGLESDLYSLGCVMYEVYTGMPAFGPGAPFEIMLRHINEPPSPDPFVRWAGEIPIEIERTIFKLLAKDPKERPGSAREVREVLARHAN